MEKSKIIMQGDCEFVDVDVRNALPKIERKIDVANERTKIHTLDIKKIEKRLKSLEDMRRK